jgi:anti-sigma factor RsiW
MDCERCADDLTAYLDGELSETKTLEVKSHLDLCQSCREEYRSLELSTRFVETHVRELQVQPQIWSQVQARISAMEAPAPSPGLFQLLTLNPWWGAAAAVVGTAVLTVGLWGYIHNQAAKQNLVEYMTQYIQAREVQEQAHRAQILTPENSGTEAGIFHAEYMDNPFVAVDSNPDMNPFRPEDQ